MTRKGPGVRARIVKRDGCKRGIDALYIGGGQRIALAVEMLWRRRHVPGVVIRREPVLAQFLPWVPERMGQAVIVAPHATATVRLAGARFTPTARTTGRYKPRLARARRVVTSDETFEKVDPALISPSACVN